VHQITIKITPVEFERKSRRTVVSLQMEIFLGYYEEHIAETDSYCHTRRMEKEQYDSPRLEIIFN